MKKLTNIYNRTYRSINCDRIKKRTLNNNIKPTTHRNLYKNYKNGFSLIELMVSIAIISLLISTATPTFNSVIGKSKLSKTSGDLLSSLSLARQYAITSGHRVHLCALDSINPIQCQQERDFNASWSNGWVVFADINKDNEYDQGDTILNLSPKPKAINVVFNQHGRLRFFQDGSARSAGFYICSKNTSDNRHIKLLYSGRARSTKISNPSQLTTCLSTN